MLAWAHSVLNIGVGAFLFTITRVTSFKSTATLCNSHFILDDSSSFSCRLWTTLSDSNILMSKLQFRWWITEYSLLIPTLHNFRFQILGLTETSVHQILILVNFSHFLGKICVIMALCISKIIGARPIMKFSITFMFFLFKLKFSISCCWWCSEWTRFNWATALAIHVGTLGVFS